MGKKQKKTKNNVIKTLIIIAIFIILAIIENYTDIFAFEDIFNNISSLNNKKIVKNVEGKLEMHTIDVGQGDSILLLQGNKVMLVDCGPKARGKNVVNYLKDLGIEKIDILVGTHPHEDHMGGMAEVINSFDIGVVYTADFTNEEITTNYYLNFLDAVENKNVNWEMKKTNDKFEFGEADVTVLAPSKNEYSNANNYSLVLMVSFGETDIMLTGDAEKLIEEEILKLDYDIECEILKAGHHGSDTSNSKKFLQEVNPSYIIISAGLDNSYKHPIKSVMNMIKNMGITVYRTDEAGDIIMTTDGKNIEFNKEEGSYLSGPELVEKKGS